jgi:transcriptional regulator with XRE-family HTH domain
VKRDEQYEARRLRADEGRSVKAIAAELGVSTSSVSRWVRDIPLTAEQQATLSASNPAINRQLAGSAIWSEMCRERRRAWQEEGRVSARAGDPLHRAGCMLFWAEGTKSQSNVIVTNSDVSLLQHVRRFLVECYDVDPVRFAFTCNVFLGNGLELGEIERRWLDALELPRSTLRPSIVNRPSSASRRRGRVLLLGTGRLALPSVRIVQSIYGAIQEYAGFERPEWLG